jgi:predicted kinase
MEQNERRGEEDVWKPPPTVEGRSIDVVLISGLPGSGKTTIARTLAQQLPRSACISCDQLRHMIVGGFKWAGEPWDAETRRQYLAPSLEAVLSRNRGRGQPVREDVIRRLHQDFMRQDYAEWLVLDTTELSDEHAVLRIRQFLSW